jgi:hypothetical protein
VESRCVRLRALFATGAVVAGALFFGWKEAFSPWGVEWFIVALAAVYGIAGLALQVRSMIAQVLVRGALWLAVLPVSLFTVESIAEGRLPETSMLSTVVLVGAALALSRPLLDTERARRALAPTQCRSLFLASAVSSSSAGLLTLFISILDHNSALGLIPLSALLLATAIGIVRMRAWSILTGALSLPIALLLSATLGVMPSIVIVAPSILLLATLLHARSKAARSATSSTSCSCQPSFVSAAKVVRESTLSPSAVAE